MKLRFLCPNHRQWLCDQPGQALHWCSNAFETGRCLTDGAQWEEALPHLGCAFETAEILMTTRSIAPASALQWFIHTLGGLTQTLAHLGRTAAAKQIYQAAINRLRTEAASTISPELEARIYQHITRLNRERRQVADSTKNLAPMLTLVEPSPGVTVYH